MRIILTAAFKKSFKKRILPHDNLKQRFYQRRDMFLADSQYPLIRDHALTGKLVGKRAFWITGDIRTVYYLENDIAYLVDIGTHNQVYR